jgi:uncharacterized membrane protein YedE/YeeE
VTLVSLSPEQMVMPVIGGAVIGISVSLLLLLIGRVFGVSGILGGTVFPVKGDTYWRLAALLGFPVAGLVMAHLMPATMAAETPSDIWVYCLAGVLVGFGTQMGSGCTSGHGVCGISRFSPRSIVATLCFMAAGFATVTLLRQLGGL